MSDTERHQEKRLRDWAAAGEVDDGRKKARKQNGLESKYKRGEKVKANTEINPLLKKRIKYREKLFAQAAKGAAQIEEWLLPAEGGFVEAEEDEKTYQFSQREIVEEVEIGAARKAFDLKLDQLGPYKISFSNNGRHLLIGGRKGHLAQFDWTTGQLICETHVRETVHDVQFLHNHLYWAAAQKKYVYIYNQDGAELHCLKSHMEPFCLDFLRYHFLLCSIGERGHLRWQDTSTGDLVANFPTRKGPCRVMRQNPWNAVLCLGHSKGTVSMWTPNQKDPVVKMLCHKGPVKALAVDPTGHYIVTAGCDFKIKVWDIRKYEELHNYFSFKTPECLDVSQKGLLAVGFDNKVEIWKDALSEKQADPYLRHELHLGSVDKFRFCPYEDVLGIGHSGGVSTMLVPGAGEANFDSFVANPFQTKAERQRTEVNMLLDKIQPELIMLDPNFVGKVMPSKQDLTTEKTEPSQNGEKKPKKKKTKMKGKNKESRVQGREQNAVFRKRAKEGGKEREKQEELEGEPEDDDEVPAGVPFALRKFYK